MRDRVTTKLIASEFNREGITLSRKELERGFASSSKNEALHLLDHGEVRIAKLGVCSYQIRIIPLITGFPPGSTEQARRYDDMSIELEEWFENNYLWLHLKDESLSIWHNFQVPVLLVHDEAITSWCLEAVVSLHPDRIYSARLQAIEEDPRRIYVNAINART